MKKNLGMLLLGIWLVLYGLIGVVNFSFKGLSLVMGLLAIVAGVMVIMGK